MKKLIYISSTNTIAGGSLVNPGTEVNQFDTALRKSNYAYSKYYAEKMVLEAAEKQGLKNVPLNFVNARMLCAHSYFSAQKAVRELKMPQSPVRKAITEAVEWFIMQGMLEKSS